MAASSCAAKLAAPSGVCTSQRSGEARRLCASQRARCKSGKLAMSLAGRLAR